MKTERLYHRLKEYGESGTYPFHMPGHKRRYAPQEAGEVYRMDITEIEGFDNLHDARGILLAARQFAAGLYRSEETYFSVNGSSGAILAAIGAVCPPGSRILIGRNCHKAVYHAIEIGQLEAFYVYPQIHPKYAVHEGIYPQDIDKEWINCPDCRAIVITSPTYDGVVSDIRQICSLAHVRGIPVIVDEAHGAHLPFSDYFPDSALACGADIVIQSTHKTLPALTQTAILHVRGDLVDRDLLRRMLTVYQTSSPSYLLMGSIDDCMHTLADRGPEMFAAYTERLDGLRADLAGCRSLHLLEMPDLDPARTFALDRSKLVLFAGPGRGSWLYTSLLREYGLQMEMVSADYVLAMTSVCDDEEGYDRLRKALFALDRQAERMPEETGAAPGADGKSLCLPGSGGSPGPVRVMKASEAARQKKQTVSLAKAAGQIAGEYIYLYPPGVPLLVPGEIITQEDVNQILSLAQSRMEIIGVRPCRKGAKGSRRADAYRLQVIRRD